MPTEDALDEINGILDSADVNPRHAQETFRRMQLNDPRVFGLLCLEILLTRESEAGMRLLCAVLADNEPLINRFCVPNQLPREQAVRALRRLMVNHPLIDLRLLRAMKRKLTTDDGATEWMLDLLDGTSLGTKLVPMVTPLMSSENARIRSKATLFVGRRTRNLGLVRLQLREANARVRANAIEGMYGVDTAEARKLLWLAVRDPDNRVRGNALLGLYMLGELGAVPQIEIMAGHLDPRFRRTAAWVIGRTQDPRYFDALMAMRAAAEPEVRAEALKGLARVRLVINAAENANRLRLTLLGADADTKKRKLAVCLRDSSGSPVFNAPAPGFIVREGERNAMRYSVRENWTREHINAVFLLDATWAEHDPNFEAAREGVARALAYKRAGDSWAILSIRPGDPYAYTEVADLPMTLQSSAPPLERALRMEPVSLCQPLERALPQLAERAASSIGLAMGRRHIVCAVDEHATFFDYSPSLVAIARASSVAIHIVCIGDQLPASGLECLTRATGGMFLRVGAAAGIPDAYQTLASALVGHYEVVWEGNGRPKPSTLRLFVNGAMGELEWRPDLSAEVPEGTAMEETGMEGSAAEPGDAEEPGSNADLMQLSQAVVGEAEVPQPEALGG